MEEKIEKIGRKFFIESSIESIEAIFFNRYKRYFNKREHFTVKFLMLKHGVFCVRAAMSFCSELFESSKDAVKNLNLVCRVRPE